MAVALYFHRICLICTFCSDDAWFINEMHSLMMQFWFIIYLF